jgi:hypothetical protein
MSLLAVLTPEGWRPGVGDPTVAGWTLVALYLLAATAAWWARRAGRRGAAASRRWPGPERRGADRSAAYRAHSVFWLVLLVVCTLLGVNKQLDLQAWITDVVRTLAVEQGWHEERRVVQAVIVGVIGIGGLAALAGIVAVTRRLLPRHLPAFIALGVLLAYAALRTVSLHHLDAVLRDRTLGWRHGELIEAGAVLCIAGCAVLTSRWVLRRRRPRPAWPRSLPSR